MIQNVPKRVLVVGATGLAGNKLVRYLLKENGAAATLAGKSSAKLSVMRSGLRRQDPEHRLEILEIEATNLDSAAWGISIYSSMPRQRGPTMRR